MSSNLALERRANILLQPKIGRQFPKPSKTPPRHVWSPKLPHHFQHSEIPVNVASSKHPRGLARHKSLEPNWRFGQIYDWLLTTHRRLDVVQLRCLGQSCETSPSETFVTHLDKTQEENARQWLRRFDVFLWGSETEVLLQWCYSYHKHWCINKGFMRSQGQRASKLHLAHKLATAHLTSPCSHEKLAMARDQSNCKLGMMDSASFWHVVFPCLWDLVPFSQLFLQHLHGGRHLLLQTFETILLQMLVHSLKSSRNSCRKALIL